MEGPLIFKYTKKLKIVKNMCEMHNLLKVMLCIENVRKNLSVFFGLFVEKKDKLTIYNFYAVANKPATRYQIYSHKLLITFLSKRFLYLHPT